MVANTSINLPDHMVEQIEDRREKGTNRSEYIRQAVAARFDAEDAGEWDDVNDPLDAVADD